MSACLFFFSIAFVHAQGQQNPTDETNAVYDLPPNVVACASEPVEWGHFSLLGLTGRATIAESLFVYTSELPAGSTVTFFLDGKPLRRETQAPFWLGGQDGGIPRGYPGGSLVKGDHQLNAIAATPSGETYTSSELRLHVVASINPRLSNELSVYSNHISSQTETSASLFKRSYSPGANLSASDIQTRCEVLSLYKNWGIDPTLDPDSDNSAVLIKLLPAQWSKQSVVNDHNQLSLRFSRDAPYYQEIPADWPRVALPTGYIQHIQLSTPRGGDGIGFGEVVARLSDPQLTVRSQWYNNEQTRRVFPYRMPSDWASYLPSQANGDRHLIFVDPQKDSFVSAYKASVDPETGGPRALFASAPTPLCSLGDHGGSNAAGIAELPLLVQPGEATDPDHPIRHAIGGAVARTWAARVYPATAWDANIRTRTNPCTNRGSMNTGLVPYGGVLQLDPALNLGKLNLSLPARRLLEAIQTHGYYVMDFGCADLDIYTAAPASEFEPFGGLWGYNRKGPGVQAEVERVLSGHRLFVVAPLTKKE
jgi:hypothetical protein